MLLLAAELKRMLPKEYTCKLKNIIINGEVRGCNGFIQQGLATVYVNTENLNGLFLARTARDDKDYRGGRNVYAQSRDSLAVKIGDLLEAPHVEV